MMREPTPPRATRQYCRAPVNLIPVSSPTLTKLPKSAITAPWSNLAGFENFVKSNPFQSKLKAALLLLNRY